MSLGMPIQLPPKKPIKEEPMNNTYFWNLVTISSKLNSLATTRESTEINNLA